MFNIYKRKKIAVVTLVYWFLLVYIIAALIWWYISLQQQNELMYNYRLSELNERDFFYAEKNKTIEQSKHAKTIQYIGEGLAFFIVILVGAVFVYRAVRKQLRLSQQQQNFMMAVTHEFKTPLAIINLNLETIERRKLEPIQQSKIIANTLQEATRLNSLTNNILVASQLESGNYQIHKQEINLSELIQAEVKTFMARYPDRIIQSSITPDLHVDGEPLLLQMLCSNLIDNALKYSSKDKPVQITLVQQDNKCQLSVIDMGVGIATEEKNKVFKKFYRTGNESTRKTKGTGLGLFLCKRIVTDHKGSIDIMHNTPQGSIFTVTLQLL